MTKWNGSVWKSNTNLEIIVFSLNLNLSSDKNCEVDRTDDKITLIITQVSSHALENTLHKKLRERRLKSNQKLSAEKPFKVLKQVSSIC